MPKVKKLEKILLLAIFLLAFFLRFYRLSSNPPGLYIDEVSIGYNAYSILKTGRDEHKQFLPLWFRAFDEYKLPVYIYLTAVSEWLFGVNEFAIRFSSAFFGALTVIVFHFLVKSFLEPRTNLESAIASLFLAISPWHIHFSRAGFEANVALFFVGLATLFFVLSIKRSHYFLFLLSFLSFILSLYTYNACRTFTPLFLLGLLVIYRKQIEKFHFGKLALILIFSLFLALPFLKFAFSPEGLARARTESFFFQIETKKDANVFSKLSSYLAPFFKSYLSYFSLDFLFFIGDQNGRHSVREIGEIYLWQLPFLLLGFYLLLRRMGEEKAYLEKITSLWLFLSPLAASLTKVNPHALRSLFMVVPLQMIISLGVLETLKMVKRKVAQKVIFLLIFLSSLYNFIFYFHIYWVHYPKKTFLDWDYGYKQLVEKVQEVEGRYNKVLISNYRSPHTSLFFLFYKKFDPKKYLKSGNLSSFSKYSFVEKPSLSFGQEKILYAASPSEILTNASLLDEIKFPDGNTIYKLYELK